MKPFFMTKLCCLLLLIGIYPAQAENVNIDLLYVGDTNSNAHKGVLQGLEEANLQGQFLGQQYSLKTINTSDYSPSSVKNVVAIFVAADMATQITVSQSHPDHAVFNISETDDDLRQRCTNNLLHVLPSDRMMSDAEAQWQKKEPGSGAKAQAWHPDFVKFAARDLNKRFKKSHGQTMDDAAWAGWAAIKMVSDTIVREKMTEPAELLNYLKNDLAFDGQKGLKMSFRETGQLRQPVLLVENDKIVSEAPVRGIAKPPTVESLGLLNCQK